jgi:hypothetical protein
MTISTLVRAAGGTFRRWGRETGPALPRPLAPVLIAGAWFVAVFATILWVWGLNSRVLISPDEALNRFAAGVISKQWRPFLALPFPDPEDIAHPRHWVSVGERAIPSYAPVAIYFYGLLLRLNMLGSLLVPALPASAAAAFALGTAKLLPDDRKWLCVFAPMLGFPALYWLMRPWMNLSALLICVCWSFFFWTSWQTTGKSRDLTIAIFGLGAAAAVRPDYAAYLLLVTLLFGLAASPRQWRRVTLLVVSAGASAVALNLFFNWVITGHPLLAAYQIVAARDEGTSGPGGPLGLLRQLLVPMGVPQPKVALAFLLKYWVEMGPVAALSLAQLAIVPLLLRKPRSARVFYALGLLVMFCFVLSHMDEGLNGASDPLSAVHHSMPRYWAPVYLLAALPPIVFLARCRWRPAFVAGVALALALALGSGYEIGRREGSSLVKLYAFAQRWGRIVPSLANKIPRDAMVYSGTLDKVLWSYWRVGTMSEPGPTASSMRRAIDANLEVYLFEPRFPRARLVAFERALREKQLSIASIDRRGIFRVSRSGP